MSFLFNCCFGSSPTTDGAQKKDDRDPSSTPAALHLATPSQSSTDPEPDRCRATTAKGTRCTFAAKTSDGFCRKHAPDGSTPLAKPPTTKPPPTTAPTPPKPPPPPPSTNQVLLTPQGKERFRMQFQGKGIDYWRRTIKDLIRDKSLAAQKARTLRLLQRNASKDHYTQIVLPVDTDAMARELAASRTPPPTAEHDDNDDDDDDGDEAKPKKTRAPFDIEHINECQMMGHAIVYCETMSKTLAKAGMDPNLVFSKQGKAVQNRLGWLKNVQNSSCDRYEDVNLTVTAQKINVLKGQATKQYLESIDKMKVPGSLPDTFENALAKMFENSYDDKASLYAKNVVKELCFVEKPMIELLEDPTVPAAVDNKQAFRREMQAVAEEFGQMYGMMGM